MEVGNRGDEGQAPKCHALKMAPATRHPGSSKSESVCVSRRPVQLSGVIVSSKTNGRVPSDNYFNSLAVVIGTSIQFILKFKY